MSELALNTKLPTAGGAEPCGPLGIDLFWLSLLDDLHALVETEGFDARQTRVDLGRDALEWPVHWHPLVERWAARIEARSIELSPTDGLLSTRPWPRIHTGPAAHGPLEAHPPPSGGAGPIIRAHSMSPDGFKTRQAHEFHAFCSHFHTALALHTALDAAQERLAALYRVIDALPLCIAMIDERRDVVLLNNPCREWLARTRQLEVRERRLCVPARPAALDLALSAFLADPSAPAHSLQLEGLDIQLTKVGPAKTVEPQWAGAKALPLGAAPAPPANVLMFIREQCDPAKVREIATPPAVLARMVQQRYALTDRELQLAWNLAEGLSLKQIAGLTARSVETLRAQLKSVFRKLGTRDQSGVGPVMFASLQASALRSMGEHLAAAMAERAPPPHPPMPSLACPPPWQ
jgi:DNA-binding CsgD family transcriptional regulator